MRAYQFITEDSDEDYRIPHRAPMHDSGSPLHDLSGTYPDDIYGPNGIQYYGTRDPADAQSMRIIRLSKGKPNQGIQIFRAVPADVKANTINPGDWVSISRLYAEQHGQGLGKYKILSKVVSAKTLYTNGDSLHEWGYDPSGAAATVAEDYSHIDFSKIPVEPIEEMQLESLRQMLLAKPAVFEDTADYKEFIDFLELHRPAGPIPNSPYLYASIYSILPSRTLSIAHFNRPFKFIKIVNNQAYFDIGGEIKPYPEANQTLGDLLKATFFFSSLDEFKKFVTLAILKFGSWNLNVKVIKPRQDVGSVVGKTSTDTL